MSKQISLYRNHTPHNSNFPDFGRRNNQINIQVNSVAGAAKRGHKRQKPVAIQTQGKFQNEHISLLQRIHGNFFQED